MPPGPFPSLEHISNSHWGTSSYIRGSVCFAYPQECDPHCSQAAGDLAPKSCLSTCFPRPLLVPITPVWEPQGAASEMGIRTQALILMPSVLLPDPDRSAKIISVAVQYLYVVVQAQYKCISLPMKIKEVSEISRSLPLQVVIQGPGLLFSWG